MPEHTTWHLKQITEGTLVHPKLGLLCTMMFTSIIFLSRKLQNIGTTPSAIWRSYRNGKCPTAKLIGLVMYDKTNIKLGIFNITTRLYYQVLLMLQTSKVYPEV